MPGADACLDAGQEDRVRGCTNLLNCWEDNDCTKTSCEATPMDVCGQNVVIDYSAGVSYAGTVYSALCQ